MVFVVTYKGNIIAERYGQGIDMHTPLESWSKQLVVVRLGHSAGADVWREAALKGMDLLMEAVPDVDRQR